MLVLSRHENESIIIDLSDVDVNSLPDKRITIMVTEILHEKVRLGFTANRAIPIHRDDVQVRVDLEREKGRDSA